MLRALIRAEHFIIEKPDQARLLATERVGLREEELTPIWKDYYFRVSLDQSLLINLENQAHWAIANKLVPGTKVPNYVLIGRPPEVVDVEFKDVPTSSPQHASIDRLSDLGIIKGYADGTFKPNDQVTRGQLAMIVDRALKYMGK